MPYPCGFEAMVFREYLMKSGILCGKAANMDLHGAWMIPLLKDDGVTTYFTLPVVGVPKGERPKRYTRSHSWVRFLEYNEGDAPRHARGKMWPHSEEVFIGMFTTLWTPRKSNAR